MCVYWHFFRVIVLLVMLRHNIQFKTLALSVSACVTLECAKCAVMKPCLQRSTHNVL